MAYSEELDLIQNVKNLDSRISNLLDSYEQVEPSMNQIFELRDQFQELRDSTIAVIEQYDSTLNDKTEEIDNLLESCRSQFKQVTDDVESLVNLQVNFNSIKDKISACLALGDKVADLLGGITVIMTPGNIVPVSNRKAYKRYLEVTETINK